MKNIHFIGIGGISMSGIALVLHKRGYIITGSDSTKTKLTEDLESKGIKVYYGHSRSNIAENVDLIVRTSTVGDTNPEIMEAVERGIKITERYEMLNFISKYYNNNLGVAGSHGKTTSSSYLWKILQSLANKNVNEDFTNPSLFLGSVIYDESINGNCFEQIDHNLLSQIKNTICVYETDESDRSFEKMNIDHAIITNIDNDHLEFYSNSFFNLYDAFVKFATQIINKKGILLIGIDFEYSKKLYNDLKIKYKHASIFSYSLNQENADYFAKNIKDDGIYTVFDLYKKNHTNPIIKEIKIPNIGKHNVFNAIGAISLVINLFNNQALKYIDGNVFDGLKGIDKRFMLVGKVKITSKSQNVIDVDIVDDYAHHPTEITTIIKAVNDSKRWDNFLLVFEPHKYTRVVSIYDDFLTAFKEAKDVIVMDIFGVSGGLKTDITKDKFVNDIKKHSNNTNIIISKSNQSLLEEIFDFIKNNYTSNNSKTLVLFIGAGLSSYFAKKTQTFFNKLS